MYAREVIRVVALTGTIRYPTQSKFNPVKLRMEPLTNFYTTRATFDRISQFQPTSQSVSKSLVRGGIISRPDAKSALNPYYRTCRDPGCNPGYKYGFILISDNLTHLNPVIGRTSTSDTSFDLPPSWRPVRAFHLKLTTLSSHVVVASVTAAGPVRVSGSANLALLGESFASRICPFRLSRNCENTGCIGPDAKAHCVSCTGYV